MDIAVSIIVSIIGSGFLTTVYTNWHADRKARENVDTSERKALLALCRDRILVLSKSYKHMGSIPVDEYESYDELVEAYISLGGNGAVKKLSEEVKSLETSNE